MRWGGKDLKTPGQVTDAALQVTRAAPKLAPLFLAAYAEELALNGVDNAAFVALNNLVVMAGHYDEDSFRYIVDTFGSIHQARLFAHHEAQGGSA